MSIFGNQQSKSTEWYTPPEFFELLHYPSFDLDPCHPGLDVVNWLPVDKVYTQKEDGLRQQWRGSVWLNPPFGHNKIEPWLEKMNRHRNGLVLIPARTDTIWFHTLATKADLLGFIAGRIQFLTINKETGQLVKVKGNPCGSIILAYGQKWIKRLDGLFYTVKGRK